MEFLGDMDKRKGGFTSEAMTGVVKWKSSGLSESDDENLARDLRGRHYVPTCCKIDEAAC
jgi:hypothetical protein